MNKIITMLVIASAVSINATAQFEKGSYLAGGSFSFSWQKTAYGGRYTNGLPSVNQSSGSESPQFGIFVANNLALGAGLSFTQTRVNNIATFVGPGIEYKTQAYTGYTFTPFARYYIERFFLHINYDLGYGYQSGEDNGQAIPDKRSKVHGFKTGVGYAILLNKHVALEPFLGYAYTRNDSNNDNYEYRINTLFLQVGIQVYLGKKN